MNEHEIERMVVRLIGDGSSFTKMAETASKDATSAAKTVEGATNKIQGFSKGLGSFASSALSALGALGAKAMMGDWFHKFSEAEAGELALTAALEGNGRAVEETMAQYKGFAESMQDVTVLDDDAVLSLLRTAETFSLTGDAAEKAAQDAISLGAVTKQGAESMTRLTAAMAKGDIKTAMRFARMIPQLRGIRDETQFVTKYQNLLNTGWKTATAQANTTSGQITQLGNAYDNLKEDLGGTVAQGLKPFVGIAKQVVKLIAGLDSTTKAWIVGVAAAVAVLLALGPALLVAKIALSPLITGLTFLTSNLIIQPALWMASTVASLAYSAATTVLQTAVWLLNAALTATNGLMFVLFGVALVALVYVVAVAIAAVGAALYAAYKTGQNLWEVFSNLSTSTGGLSKIGDMFREWGGILRDVFKAMQTNMSLAFELLKAGGKLAIEQLKQYWPPFWTFVREGWNELSRFITKTFSMHWKIMFAELLTDFAEQADVFGLQDSEVDKLRDKIASLHGDVGKFQELLNQSTISQLNVHLNNLDRALKGVEDNEDVKKARAEVERIRGEIGKAVEAEKKGGGLGADAKDNMEKAAKAAEKFDAAVSGSAEAQSRIAAYTDLIRGGKGGMIPAAGAGVPGGGLDDEDAVDVLTDMRDLMKKDARSDAFQVEVSSIT